MEKIPENKELSEKALESLSKVRPENDTNKRFVLSKEDFSNERLTAVKEEVEEIKEKYPEVLSLCMFGSMVKGTAHEGSDVDAYLYIDSAKAAERKGVTEEEILETHERLDEVYLTKEVAKLYILEFRNGLKEKADLEDKDVEHIRSRPISEKIINDEIKALTDYYTEKEKIDTFYERLAEWEKKKPEVGVSIDELLAYQKSRPEMPRSPSLVMPDLGPMFHLEVGGGIRKYRKMFLDKLVELGPVGEKIWAKTIESTEIMENNLSTDESKRYPRTLADAVRVYSPESSLDQNHSQEFKGLIKQTLFGDSFEKWKKLFPEELYDEVDKESLVDKYVESIGNDTELPSKELKEKLSEFSGKLNSYGEVLAESGIYPSFYRDAFHDWVRGEDVFKDKEAFSSFVWNHTLRKKEKVEDEPARMKERLEREPIADNEESNAGIYREGLEPQVAEAVFALRKKGYGTFQSGYDDLITGSQFIDFNQEDTETLKNTFTVADLQSLAREGLRVEIKEKPDRATFVLIPNDGRQSPDYWKTVWNSIAEKLPDKGKPAEPPVNLGSYGTFMERQLKLRNGEKTYLGYGLEYDGSKVVEKKEE